ncbi:MAG: hypothetical protein H8D87_20340 [Deltaproteobacteria bacterium]|uniref:coiled-coil domain-containing protein n=1 Tax=Desulfobacula sp. TaxID=2593537 RepID=UPI0019878B17|nr:hypothetical protein [Candidatus Desulfobacula maris]MBL6992306.1 hypothetical protein [Desulfobacula sp.]
MSFENTYKYFITALNEWINHTGHGHKKILSNGCGCGQSYITQLLTPKRNKPIPFEWQVKIAETCDMPYIEFLQHGKNLLEGKSKKQINSPESNETNRENNKEMDETVKMLLLQNQELINDLKQDKAGLKQEKAELNDKIAKLEDKIDRLREKYDNRVKELGEAYQALKNIEERQTQDLETNKPVANG